MTTRTFNISALSPILQYDPPQDVTNSVWKSDSGGITLGNLDSGAPARILHGTGTVTVTGFGSGLGFYGSLTGVYCTYTATLSPGPNTPSPSPAPPVQTAPPSTGMLASFTGLAIGNWQLVLKGVCANGSGIKVADATVDGWVGVQGADVKYTALDDMDTSINYSGVDWSATRGLQARFYDDTQHYTAVSGATLNYTFSGSGIVVWASVDNQHGPFSSSLFLSSSPPPSSSSSSSSSSRQLTGYNPFLAVPVPYLLVTGLDPSQSYTLVLQNAATAGAGTYLDLDYIEVFSSTGGAPPNGGTSALQSFSSPSNTNLGLIIGAALGGAAGLLLLLGVIWFCWRRRKIQVEGGTRPLDTPPPHARGYVGTSPENHVPLQMQGNVLPIPFHSTGGGHSGSNSMHASFAERQGLLYGGSPPNTANPIPSSGSSGYDPYAQFGGGYPMHNSSNSGLTSPIGGGGVTDPVQARRQGKTAEMDAARERAMRVQNTNGSMMIMSPTTTNPHNNGFMTHSTVSQSWDTSSHGGSTPVPTTTNTGTTLIGAGAGNSTTNLALHTADVKTPDEPPPSYDLTR